MNIKTWIGTLACVAGAVAMFAHGNADAHDGGFGHSRRTIFFDAAADEFVLEYRVTRNSDEALLEMTLIDADGDGKISLAEQQKYFQTLGTELAEQFEVQTVAGMSVRPRLVELHLQPNLVQSFRYAIATTAAEIRFVDRNFPHKPGVAKIVTGRGAKAELAEATDLNHAERVTLKVVRVAR
jgi:hypothetical protein